MNQPTGLGQQALGHNPTPHARLLAADLDHIGIQVTPQNVLHIRNAVLGAGERLRVALEGQARGIRVGPPGGDPISQRWADATNDKLQPLIAECWSYVNAYKDAGENLAQIARGYGYTEQAIRDSFNKHVKENQGMWGQRLQENQAIAGLPSRVRDLVDISPSRPIPQSAEDLLRGGLE